MEVWKHKCGKFAEVTFFRRQQTIHCYSCRVSKGSTIAEQHGFTKEELDPQRYRELREASLRRES